MAFTKYGDWDCQLAAGAPGYRLRLRVASQQGQTFCLQDLELVAAWCVLQGPVHAEHNLEITNSYSFMFVKKKKSQFWSLYHSPFWSLSSQIQSLPFSHIQGWILNSLAESKCWKSVYLHPVASLKYAFTPAMCNILWCSNVLFVVNHD